MRHSLYLMLFKHLQLRFHGLAFLTAYGVCFDVVQTLEQYKRCYRFALVRFPTKPCRASISLISAIDAHGSPARHFLDSFSNQRPNSRALRIVNLKALRLDAALPSGVRAPVLRFQGCQL
ncbi:MAG: hypothetical protein V4563_13205 [Pseudomonadota bacterium]